MTTLGPRAAKLHDAIQELGEHERGNVTLPVTTITDWKQAAAWAADRIAVLEADVVRKDALLRQALDALEKSRPLAYHFDAWEEALRALNKELSK